MHPIPNTYCTSNVHLLKTSFIFYLGLLLHLLLSLERAVFFRSGELWLFFVRVAFFDKNKD